MDEWDITYIPWEVFQTGSYTEEDKVCDRAAGESILDVARRWAKDGRIIEIKLVER